MSHSRARLFPRPGRANLAPAGLRRLPRPAELAERLARTRSMDRAVGVLADSVGRRLSGTTAADVLHGVWLGLPAHAALSGLPLGFWTSALALDAVPGSQRAARTLIALGLASAAPAAAAGLADWSVLHREQQRVGLVHAGAAASTTALFAASLAARSTGREQAGRRLALAGAGVLAAGAYLGRYLAFPLGAGASHAEPVGHLAPLGWHDLCRIYELPDGRLARRRFGYLSLAVLRRGPEVLAVSDQCAHLGGPLHQGTITGERGELCVVCPWHGSTFRMRDGAVCYGPATARQPAFETRLVEGGMVQVRPAGLGG